MFKPGDKVRCLSNRHVLHMLTLGEVYIVKKAHNSHVEVKGSPYMFANSRFVLEEKENEMKKYETGRWHNWNGDGECPLPEGTKAWIACFDSSKNGFHDRNPEKQRTQKVCGGINVYPWETKGIVSHNPYGGAWKHGKNHANVIAFYVESYPEEAKEMTVEEIQKQLGFKVKIVE